MKNTFQRRDAETPRSFIRCCMLIAVSAFTAHAQGLLYTGAWPKQILVIDEAQQKVVDHIQLETGTPRHIEISYDRKKLFATTWEHSGVEVIDLATRKVVNHFLLNEGNRK